MQAATAGYTYTGIIIRVCATGIVTPTFSFGLYYSWGGSFRFHYVLSLLPSPLRIRKSERLLGRDTDTSGITGIRRITIAGTAITPSHIVMTTTTVNNYYTYNYYNDNSQDVVNPA